MLWITLNTDNETEYIDAVNFLIKDGNYTILLMDGSIRTGKVSDILFLHVEYSGKDGL